MESPFKRFLVAIHDQCLQINFVSNFLRRYSNEYISYVPSDRPIIELGELLSIDSPYHIRY